MHQVNIIVPVCLLRCSFKFTGTLIFVSAVTGTDTLAAVFIKYLFSKVLPYLLYCKDTVKPCYYIKGVHRVKKTICSLMFYKIVVLKSFCKTPRKTPASKSLFIRVADIKRVHHKCFPMKCFSSRRSKSNNA